MQPALPSVRSTASTSSAQPLFDPCKMWGGPTIKDSRNSSQYDLQIAIELSPQTRCCIILFALELQIEQELSERLSQGYWQHDITKGQIACGLIITTRGVGQFK